MLSLLASGHGPLGAIRESVDRSSQTQSPRDASAGCRATAAVNVPAGVARGGPARAPAGRAPSAARRARRPRRGRHARCRWRCSRCARAALAALRFRARRRRRYVRHWLLPYRADEATPDQVHAAARVVAPDDAAALVAAAASRASRRSRSSCTPYPTQAGSRVRLVARLARRAGPRRGARRPARRLLPRHADWSRATGELAWLGHVLRLKKRRSFTTRLETPERYEQSLVDGLVATMSAAGRALHRPVRAHARARVVRSRRALALPQRGAPARAGARPCRGRRPRRALRGRPAGARGRPRAAAPAALLRRPARGGADLRDGTARRGGDPRRLGLREPARRAPHAGFAGGCTRAGSAGRSATRCPRGAAACSRPPSSPGSGTCPSPFVKGVRIERSSVPRVPAPPEVRARAGGAWRSCATSTASSAIADADKRMNAMLVGGQGTGKTSVMCRGIAADVADPNCAVIVLDGKSDLALKALSVIPEELGRRAARPLPRLRPPRGRHRPVHRRRRSRRGRRRDRRGVQGRARGRLDPGLLGPLPAPGRDRVHGLGREDRAGARDALGHVDDAAALGRRLPPRGGARDRDRHGARRRRDVLRRAAPRPAALGTEPVRAAARLAR